MMRLLTTFISLLLAAPISAFFRLHPVTPSSPPRVLVIGGTGVIGRAVARQFKHRGANVVVASRNSPYSVDIENPMSLSRLAQYFPSGVDHIVVTAGHDEPGSLGEFSQQKWQRALKLNLLSVSDMVLVLLQGRPNILRPGGSITITSGQAPRKASMDMPATAVNNAGLEAFVRSAGLDLPNKFRLNCVSPTLVAETALRTNQALTGTISADAVANFYVDLVYGNQTGQVVHATAPKE